MGQGAGSKPKPGCFQAQGQLHFGLYSPRHDVRGEVPLVAARERVPPRHLALAAPRHALRQLPRLPREELRVRRAPRHLRQARAVHARDPARDAQLAERSLLPLPHLLERRLPPVRVDTTNNDTDWTKKKQSHAS
jgi:hypothetical protein